MKITATIITFNEESNIQAACESVAWADEIVVVDSESTDATRDIALSAGATSLKSLARLQTKSSLQLSAPHTTGYSVSMPMNAFP